MDLQLIGYWLFELSTYSWVTDPDTWLMILKVAFGLGMVIFVHELGHFGVAKLCGVQCDKFYLGFDIAGWKLCKFKWGETEYGIGILPLGGYVKMLGQEDNPAKLKEEVERAKAAAEAQKTQDGKQSDEELVDIEAAEHALYDPRSYLAQSVPKRMAIISAGVIMNIIFAFICAVGAFYMGVTQTACTVGQVQPGGPAWEAGLRPDDKIVSIAGKRAYSFRDLLTGITLGDNDEGLSVEILRPEKDGEKTEKITIVVHPELDGGLFPTIGVASSYTTTLTSRLKGDKSPTIPGSAAAKASTPFKPGDKIIKIGDVEIESYGDIRRCLSEQINQPISVTILRRTSSPGKELTEPEDNTLPNAEKLTIQVAPQPMRRVGLEMTMSPVLAVKSGSPAAKTGMKAGDVLTKIDGKPVGDPLTLAARLRKNPAKTIAIEVDRNGETVPLSITPGPIETYGEPIRPGGAVGVTAMGFAYDILNIVNSVSEGSSAQKQGLKPGDKILEAVISLPDDETLKELGYEGMVDKSAAEEPIEFSNEQPNWAYFFYRVMQTLPPQSKLILTLSGESDDTRKVTLDIAENKDWFNLDRGFLLEPDTIVRKAESFGDAVTLGAIETYESATKVFVFLQKLAGGQISARALGGPVAIAKTAGHAASKGTAELFLFLTLLSANLAVINFLPIPVLDGGHMVFLAWEGIRGKPANENVQLLLSYIGLILILSLMIFVLGLDFGLISRQ
ncbi:MAG: site-2 protease family protein [Pirellulales bacterium]|nr:site-2 protease family protein [Pirellulales bacterium]